MISGLFLTKKKRETCIFVTEKNYCSLLLITNDKAINVSNFVLLMTMQYYKTLLCEKVTLWEKASYKNVYLTALGFCSHTGRPDI